MSTAPRPDTERMQKQAQKYFLVSYFFMAILAITWSLGPGFVYLLLGVIGFTLFLGISKIVQAGMNEQSYFSGGRSESKPLGVLDQLAIWLNRRAAEFKYQSGNTGSTQDLFSRLKRVARIMGISFAILIGFIIIANIVGGGDDEYDNLANAEFYYGKGKLDSAYFYYHQVLKQSPDNYQANFGLAKVANENKNYDSALYYYDRVMTISDDTDAYTGKASILYNLERYDDALNVLNTLFQRDETNGWAYLLAGDCNYMQKKYDLALPYYEKAYDLGERSKELSNIMAYIYDVQGQKDRAIVFYEETLTYGDDAEISNRIAELRR